MKKFKEFKEDDQAEIAAIVVGYAEFLVEKSAQGTKLEKAHIESVFRWLWEENIEINPETKMIKDESTVDMLNACFGQSATNKPPETVLPF